MPTPNISLFDFHLKIKRLFVLGLEFEVESQKWRWFCVYVVLFCFRTADERGLFSKGCILATSDLSAYLEMDRALWMAGALPNGVWGILHLLGWNRETDEYVRCPWVLGSNDTMELGVSSFKPWYPYMIPAEPYKEVAEYTMVELLSALPICSGLQSFAVRVVLCLLEGRARVGMMYVFPQTAWCSPSILSPPQAAYSAMVHPCFNMWWTAQCWFLLPRIYPLSS